MPEVPYEHMTSDQLHLHLVALIEPLTQTLQRLENFMASLTESVAALQGAVDTVAVRLASQLQVATDALAAAVAVAEAATIESAEDQAALDTALADAQAAADAVSAEVDELNALGAAPDAPVEVVPVEELPPAPSEEPTE